MYCAGRRQEPYRQKMLYPSEQKIILYSTDFTY
jgi:hypothetical protein